MTNPDTETAGLREALKNIDVLLGPEPLGQPGRSIRRKIHAALEAADNPVARNGRIIHRCADCGELGQYDNPVAPVSGEGLRAIVECDEDCGAFEEPETLDEYKATLEHWRTHGCLAGCSHAR